MDTPELPESNRRRRNRKRRQEGIPRWLEMAVAVTALITSISSIVLAIGNGNAMDKLVKANSVPYLLGGFSGVTPEGSRILSLDLVNNGVGPAHEKSLRVKVHGRYVLSSAEFLKAVLGSTDAQQFEGTVTKNGVRTRFVRGGATQMVFRIPRTPSNASAWERLKDDESKWDIDYCYCSVFDECWRVSSVWNEPQSVKQCTRDPPHEFMP